MLFQAHIRNGIIVPDAPITLPEGTAVTVVHEELRSVDELAAHEFAAKRLEELIAEAKKRSTLPESLTSEEAARKVQLLKALFQEMENDPPVSLQSLDREFLYGNGRKAD
jgi:hypothetical protein